MLVLAVLILVECFILFIGQRQLFGLIVQATGSMKWGYILAMPGTVLHEISHYLACKLLGVPTGHVSLFKPSQEEGSITLGYVEHAQSDPIRQTLISIAPLLLLPPLLLLVSMGFFGSEFISSPLQAIEGTPWWQIIIWGYIVLSSGQGAFPSPGDHIGIIGGLLVGIIFVLIFSSLQEAQLFSVLKVIAIILFLPAFSALTNLFVFRTLLERKRP